MPVIKVKHVISFSSEDKKFPAENLLKAEGTSKWKSSAPGEKSVSVILQLEKATHIHQLDIGNEASAFIEVLVGRSSQKLEEYQVLLVASSFMNPMESRNLTNPTRVRIFNQDKLSKVALAEKWDRVRVVCTQPFNKNIQYGLSFIKLHSPLEENDGKGGPKKQMTLGGFTVREEEADGVKIGSLFAQKKEHKPEPPLTGAAAVRAASKVAPENSSSSHTTPKPSTQSASAQPSEAKFKRKHSVGNSDDQEERSKLMKHASDSSTTSHSSSREGQPPVKRTKSDISAAGKIPLSKVMQKVVFVLSGFQNPQRGQLRDKALEMGAKYRSDWDKTCTHLICAYDNTPKYQAVAGKGKIVTKDWIKDCHRKCTLLPWRSYRLGGAQTPPASSDDSSDELATAVVSKSPAKTPKAAPLQQEVDYGGSTDDESGGDTDDDIQRFQAQQKYTSAVTAKEEDPYGASTDEEMEEETNGAKNGLKGSHSEEEEKLPVLPDFFKQKGFFLYGNFTRADRRCLLRYITAYNGILEEYMDEKVLFVLTQSEWDKNFDKALCDNAALTFVKPDWVYSCHNMQKLQPYQKFIIVPK